MIFQHKIQHTRSETEQDPEILYFSLKTDDWMKWSSISPCTLCHLRSHSWTKWLDGPLILDFSTLGPSSMNGSASWDLTEPSIAVFPWLSRPKWRASLYKLHRSSQEDCAENGRNAPSTIQCDVPSWGELDPNESKKSLPCLLAYILFSSSYPECNQPFKLR